MTDHQQQHTHNHGHGHGASHDDGGAGWAELLDLDADVFRDLLGEVTGQVADLAGDPRRILDLGAGTGAGTLALARRFPHAEVTAVDASGLLLARLAGKARDLGLADRVHTVEADLDAAWPAVGTVDLAWASASMHHMADPDRVLGEVFSALHPGGLFAVVEMDGFPRFLPDSVGDGLEPRLRALLAEAHAQELPHLGADWEPPLTRAGFTVEAPRTVTADLAPPVTATARRYAELSLGRLRDRLDGQLSPADRTTLDHLLDPTDADDGLPHRKDLTVRTTRTVWLAHRP